MSFQEHTIKTEYRSLIDNVVQKFYVPLLKEAVSYKRAVGFFSSSSLIEISKGMMAFPPGMRFALNMMMDQSFII